MLFSGDQGRDKSKLIEAMKGFGVAHGFTNLQVHEDRLIAAIKEMYQVTWRGKPISTPKHASIFKKLGAFSTSFCKHRPIQTELSKKVFGEFGSHQNAIFAYSHAVEMLHRAEFWCDKRGGWILLDVKISISAHMVQELIAALSKSSPDDHFGWASLMFESLAYQRNPEAAYPKNGMELLAQL